MCVAVEAVLLENGIEVIYPLAVLLQGSGLNADNSVDALAA